MSVECISGHFALACACSLVFFLVCTVCLFASTFRLDFHISAVSTAIQMLGGPFVPCTCFSGACGPQTTDHRGPPRSTEMAALEPSQKQSVQLSSTKYIALTTCSWQGKNHQEWNFSIKHPAARPRYTVLGTSCFISMSKRSFSNITCHFHFGRFLEDRNSGGLPGLDTSRPRRDTISMKHHEFTGLGGDNSGRPAQQTLLHRRCDLGRPMARPSRAGQDSPLRWARHYHAGPFKVKQGKTLSANLASSSRHLATSKSTDLSFKSTTWICCRYCRTISTRILECPCCLVVRDSFDKTWVKKHLKHLLSTKSNSIRQFYKSLRHFRKRKPTEAARPNKVGSALFLSRARHYDAGPEGIEARFRGEVEPSRPDFKNRGRHRYASVSILSSGSFLQQRSTSTHISYRTSHK